MEPSSSRCETPPPSYEECTRSRPTTPHSQIYIQDGDKLILIPTSNSGIIYSRPGTPQHGYQNQDQPVTIFVSPPAEEPRQTTHQISEDRDDADAQDMSLRCLQKTAFCLFFTFFVVFIVLLRARKFRKLSDSALCGCELAVGQSG
ncbi:unnamed protein product, partial [Mesorhabditis belari]|uniref:Uncharacterized protein n=1 Tax=Mesorhabditis belari TaxID=2138241 RepID=A0AAF3EZ96_9BILA